MMTATFIRVMQESDLVAADRIRESAGWNQMPADWQRVLQYQPQGCFVAERDGKLVGTVTTTSFGSALAWIGMMLVDAGHRRQGIGTALMKHALDYLNRAGVECIRLDATPAGRPVYERLGFQAEWDFQRWCGLGLNSAGPASVASFDLTAEALRLDQAAFGVCRRHWLELVAQDSTVISLNHGFGMIRPGRSAAYLGPLTAANPDTAAAILRELLQKAAGDIYWDIPSPNSAAVDLAREMGFEPVRDLTRMWTGRRIVRPDLRLQFALTDPGTG